QSNQKQKAADDAVSRIAEIACEIISLDTSCSCEFDNKVPSNLLPLMGQASAAWAELTKRLAAQVEINKAPPPAASPASSWKILSSHRFQASDQMWSAECSTTWIPGRPSGWVGRPPSWRETN